MEGGRCYPRSRKHTAGTARSCTLTKRYGDRIGPVEDLNLGVRRAEVYGFLGPSGAGRTTTSLVLLGLLKPSSETAKVLGEEPDALAGLM